MNSGLVQFTQNLKQGRLGSANGNRTRILALKGLRANRCTIAPHLLRLRLYGRIREMACSHKHDGCTAPAPPLFMMRAPRYKKIMPDFIRFSLRVKGWIS